MDEKAGIGIYQNSSTKMIASPSKKKKPPPTTRTNPIDTGTPELSKRHTLKVERGIGVVRLRNLTGTPLERMLYLEMISDREFSVLDDFVADMFRAGHLGLKASDPSRVWTKAESGGQEQRSMLLSEVNSMLLRVSRAFGRTYVDSLYAVLNCDPLLESKTLLVQNAMRLKSICSLLGGTQPQSRR